MRSSKVASAERVVPRYTSYPTAPHFVPSIGANAYASWLDQLSGPDTLSLYIHVPFCEQICLYCGCHTRATQRSEPVEAYAARLVEEIKLIAARTGCRRLVHLHWGGGTPSILGPDLLRELVAQLDVHFDLVALREHAFELDPRHVTKDLAHTLNDIGVTRTSLGVQDLSAHVQQAIGRVQPFAVVERAANTLRDAGISDLNIDLMYGLPQQSVHDVRRTVLLVHQLRPQRLAIFGYAHVPWIRRHQRLLDESALPRSAARFEQATAAHAGLTALGYQPVGLDHYATAEDSLAVAARAGTLRRNFQGYTVDDATALIGLGASAIGHLRQGFVQNAADLAGYSRAIMSGRFATVRGFALSADDRIRGRIIESLMCNLACDIDGVVDEIAGKGEHKRTSFDREIEALQPFIAEGFARIDSRRVIINDSGRPYLRLIAATFDAYLPDSQARHSVAV